MNSKKNIEESRHHLFIHFFYNNDLLIKIGDYIFWVFIDYHNRHLVPYSESQQQNIQIWIQSKMEFINFNYAMTDQHMGMLAIRLSIWENAMAVIQSHWLLGVGTGDADSALLNQYVKSGFTIGSKYDYNCHNMYLQYWLGNGILGLGLFVTYFVMLFKKAIKHKNFVFLGFLIVFALFSFTESTMRVQKGMVFFMVFSSLFYWSPLLWTKKLSE